MATLKKDLGEAGAWMDRSNSRSDNLRDLLAQIIANQNAILDNQNALIAADGATTSGITAISVNAKCVVE